MRVDGEHSAGQQQPSDEAVAGDEAGGAVGDGGGAAVDDWEAEREALQRPEEGNEDAAEVSGT